MQKRIVIFIVIFILSQMNITAIYAENDISNTTTLKGKGVIVNITKTLYIKELKYKKGIWWGTDDSFPKYLITNIDVNISGKKIYVPLSIFGDLSDPQKYYLKNLPTGIMISIEGGDTAGAYEANIIIKDSFVQKRRVKLLEFPDEAWEETVYSFPNRDR